MGPFFTNRSKIFYMSLQLCAALLLAAGFLGLSGTRVAHAEGPDLGPTSVQCVPLHIYLPLIGQQTTGTPVSSIAVQSEEDFIASVTDGDGGVPHGVYVQGVLALKVEQQPEKNSSYVSSQLGWVTQYASPTRFGVTGLLAHNNLSGKLFYSLETGNVVSLVDGDGAVRKYEVTQSYRFQVLPNNGGYLNLDTQETLTSAQLYQKMYTGGDHITFQTCLDVYGNPTWGRFFVIATPVE